MIVDLTELESSKKPVRFSDQVVLEPEDVGRGVVGGAMTVTVSGQVSRSKDGYKVEGNFSASGTLLCSRCLKELAWEASDSFSYELRISGRQLLPRELELDPEELEVVFVEQELLDTFQVALEQLLLSLPMKPLCSDNCAGICPGCGADLNTESCKCKKEMDPRWAALAQLKERIGRS